MRISDHNPKSEIRNQKCIFKITDYVIEITEYVIEIMA